jgi:hypothetical protein
MQTRPASYALNYSSKAFASFRSAVWKPSVNQPYIWRASLCPRHFWKFSFFISAMNRGSERSGSKIHPPKLAL